MMGRANELLCFYAGKAEGLRPFASSRTEVDSCAQQRNRQTYSLLQAVSISIGILW